MASDISHIQFNTRERLTSTDLNDSIALTDAALQEALSKVAGPDLNQSGVVSGFNVTVDASARTVTVTTGLGLLRDLTQVEPDSQNRWIQGLEAITASIPGSTAFDRWDVVEIAPGTVVATSSVRDIWDPTIPPSGGFAPMSVDKLIKSTPTVTVRAGADGSPNPPEFPGGTAGVIPLAYVSVDSAGVVIDGQDGLVMCRPILRAPGAFDVELTPYLSPIATEIAGQAWVQGGGLHTDGALSSLFSVARQMQGRFGLHSFGFSVAEGARLTDFANAWESGASPTVDGPVYMYALPPPYKTGYDATLAPREIHIGSAVRAQFFSAPAGTENCIMVLSETAPSTTSAQGNPTGVGTIQDAPFLNGGVAANSQRESWVYIGAIDYKESTDRFMKQDTNGAVVSLRERQPTINFVQVDNGSYPLTSPNWPTAPPSANVGHMPPYADIIEGMFSATIPAGAVPPGDTEVSVEINDDDVTGGVAESKRELEFNFTAGTPVVAWQFQLQATGNVTFTVFPTPTGLATARWYSIKYVDPFLDRR